MLISQVFSNTTIEIDDSWNLVCVRMSGGVDSTLAAYLVSKTITENNLNCKIINMTVNVMELQNGPTNSNRVEAIKQKITSLVGQDNFVNDSIIHNVFYRDAETEKLITLLTDAIANYSIDCFYAGDTLAPTADQIGPLAHSLRAPGHDVPGEGVLKSFDDYKIPFNSQTKDKTLQMFKDYNLNDLLDLTVTCDVVSGLTSPCGACYPCLEKSWAEKLVV